jgi:hypothetical protein
MRKVPDREVFSDGPIPFRRELTGSRLEVAAKPALDVITSGYWNGVRALL